MPKLKAVDAVGRDRLRIELAEAIENHRLAARELRDCRDAATQAMECKWEAQRNLESFRESRLLPDLAASFMADRACGSDDLERPEIESRDKELTLERNIETWDRTKDACESRMLIFKLP
jgi:hypothetical protein